MKKDKIIQITYGKDETYPTLLTESGKVFKYLMSDKYLGKTSCIDVFGKPQEYDIFEYKYLEIKTI